VWQFFGVLIAILSIIITTVFFIKGRKKKSLSYEILTVIPLLDVNPNVQDKVKISYEGKNVKQVHLIAMYITNDGNFPITESDYVRSLSLSFGSGKVLSAEIVDSNPPELSAALTIKEDKVLFTKTLLNEGDSFTVRILVAQFTGTAKLDGRIVGVKEVVRHIERANYIRRATIGVIVQYIGIVAFIATINNIQLFSVFIALSLAGAAIGLWFSHKDSQLKEKREKTNEAALIGLHT